MSEHASTAAPLKSLRRWQVKIFLSTWLAYAGPSPLRIVSEGDPRLFNPYSIIAVDPKRYPDITGYIIQTSTFFIDKIL